MIYLLFLFYLHMRKPERKSITRCVFLTDRRDGPAISPALFSPPYVVPNVPLTSRFYRTLYAKRVAGNAIRLVSGRTVLLRWGRALAMGIPGADPKSLLLVGVWSLVIRPLLATAAP